MFHCKLSNADQRRLQEGGNQAIVEDHAQKGLYATIWEVLWNEDFRDYEAQHGKTIANAYCATLRSQEERKQARAEKKKARAEKKKCRR
jgi:hypothetical protein